MRDTPPQPYTNYRVHRSTLGTWSPITTYKNIIVTNWTNLTCKSQKSYFFQKQQEEMNDPFHWLKVFHHFKSNTVTRHDDINLILLTCFADDFTQSCFLMCLSPQNTPLHTTRGGVLSECTVTQTSPSRSHLSCCPPLRFLWTL